MSASLILLIAYQKVPVFSSCLDLLDRGESIRAMYNTIPSKNTQLYGVFDIYKLLFR